MGGKGNGEKGCMEQTEEKELEVGERVEKVRTKNT